MRRLLTYEWNLLKLINSLLDLGLRQNEEARIDQMVPQSQ
jgi:hypothetical protein